MASLSYPEWYQHRKRSADTYQFYLILNVPDADLSTTVYEVTPDNKCYNIASAILRSRYRNSGEKPKLVKPGEQELYSFDDVRG